MSDDDELKQFMEELTANLDDEQFHDDTPPKKVEPITEEEFEAKLMSGVAMLLDSCNDVANNLRQRIKSGDNYEGTMMGFAQSTDNTIKALKFLETRQILKLKEEIKHRELETQHKHKLELEEKKNEGKAMNGVKNLTQNNTFVGSPEEFFKKLQSIESKDGDDIVDV